nr:MAG TPA: hypothetical protein [Caudoviricetes sp.]
MGIAKTFGVNEKYALYDISFINALMYSRVVPMPNDESKPDDAPAFDESKDACQDIDLTDNDDEIIVKR